MSRQRYDIATAMSSAAKEVDLAIEDPRGNWIILPNGQAIPSPQKTYRDKTKLDFEDCGKFTFENFQMREGVQDAFAYCKGWTPEMPMGLFLYGEHGCGKSHLMKALVEANATLANPIWFVSARDLIKDIFDKGKDHIPYILRDYTAPWGLVLDDIQSIQDTDYQNSFLKDLLDQRIAAKKITFATCDLGDDAIKNHFHARVLDRIGLAMHPVLMSATSYRRVQANQRRRALDKAKKMVMDLLWSK